MKVDANDILQRDGADGLRAIFDTSVTRAPRADLLLAAWLKRDLPPRDYLLGNVLSSTSRWLIFGDTGIGKTLFAMDMAGALASGQSFLNWEGRRQARVIFIDGEMPAETFKERVEIVAVQCGPNIPLFGYNRDVLGPDELPPLNTPEGEAWLWREIEAVKPDVIIFDSIMCLLAGTMAEEESWAPVKLMMRKISGRRIAQIWLHHTGHDKTKGFGTKTREWEMDTVVALTTAGESQSVLMAFNKSRMRTPRTADQFKSRMIVRNEDGWSITESEGGTATTKKTSEIEIIKTAILHAYDRLTDGVPTVAGFDGKPVRKVSVTSLREEVKTRGFLEKKDSGGLTDKARTYFNRAKSELLAPPNSRLVEQGGLIWK